MQSEHLERAIKELRARENEFEAADCYNKAALKLHGEYAVLNKI